MPSLATDLRNKLGRVIGEARQVAEAGAEAALKALAVHHYEPYPHMDADTEARRLRNHLRAHARQLGDRQDRSGRLEIAHLIHECAYEHWHRMLFARFLAENNLLIEPEMQVAISLEEAEELAREANEDMWTFASRCAQCMLPQIFRPEDPLLRLDFAREHRLKLEALLNDLDPAVFTADDSLGWVYQFWQTQKKQAINKSGVKIGADELAPVTQLFTEDYMVGFLLHNTLGAWWAGRVLAAMSPEALANADEASLRRACTLPGVEWDYLRFMKDDNGHWRPAAGTFDQWPRQAQELRILDPCMGSGHFLVAELPIIIALRIKEERLAQEEAVKAVLQDNLFGLELDPRCTQIAAFNLALAAWKLIGQPVELPPLNLACSGLAPGASREEWLQIIETADNELHFFLGQLYDLFAKASELGSLINPGRLMRGSLHADKLPALLEALNVAMEREDMVSQRFYTPEVYERGVTAQSMAQAARLLTGHYHLVATNVPYLVRNKQSEGLRYFVASQYPSAIADMAMAFLERCREFCEHGGSYATVTPQNWLFLTSYHKLRTLSMISNNEPTGANLISGLEAGFPTEAEKALWIRQGDLLYSYQDTQLRNPDARVAFEEAGEHELLAKYADGLNGMHGADSLRFRLNFWEVTDFKTWHFFQCTHTQTEHFGGREHVFYWANNGQIHRDNPKAYVKGESVWGKPGVVVSMMRELPATLYSGNKFDISCTPVVPHNTAHLPAIWCFCSSPEYNKAVRRIDRKLNVTNATLVKVPFDLDHWTKVAQKKYPSGLPKPYSDDPTQWIFHGHPAQSDEPLQVAVARLLGYRWSAEQDSTMELSDDARAWVEKSKPLLALADGDGIVCIPSVRGEPPAIECLRELLTVAFGGDWLPAMEHKLITATSSNANSLENWLRNDFFAQHCQLFYHRPFIWHIWDGRTRDGFHALVNYHKLVGPHGEGRKLLESLTYSYLGDWITRQRDGIKRGEGGADDRLAAALELEKRLKAILDGEPPFDLFVRWKPIEQQPIGWEPDINDGVRLNIRPFLANDLPNGRKGAGILRWKPNITWNKDRGQEPMRSQEQYPWFWRNGTFTGERLNDIHLMNDEKRRARRKE